MFWVPLNHPAGLNLLCEAAAPRLKINPAGLKFLIIKTMKEYNKKGGRPKKELAEKLKYRVSVKLCTQDFYNLKAHAKAARMSVAELARLAIVGCKITPRISPEQAGWFRQLSGMANNLNQIARRANTAGYDNARTEYLELAERVDNALTLLENDG